MLGFKVPKTEFLFQESKAKLCMHTQAEPHNSCTILWWRWGIMDGEILFMSILFPKLLCKSHDVLWHASCWSTQSLEWCYPEDFDSPALYITFSINCQQHDVLRGLKAFAYELRIMYFHVQSARVILSFSVLFKYVLCPNNRGMWTSLSLQRIRKIASWLICILNKYTYREVASAQNANWICCNEIRFGYQQMLSFIGYA